MKNITNDQRVKILLDSLKYIKKFHGEITVIKYGGHAMQDDEYKLNVIKDIVLLKYVGMKPIVVHGGGPEITEMMELRGLEPVFKDGLRVTDKKTMKTTEMVLSGSISPELAAIFNSNDVKSISLSGKDNRLMKARIKDEELGLVGEIEEIDTDMILNLVNDDYVPVISPVSYGDNGISLNVNSDEAAKSIAIALKAPKLILVSDVDGVYKDFNDKSSLMRRMTVHDAKTAIESGIVSGGMIPKLNACIDALENGVNQAHIINGILPHSLLLELFTQDGIGTMVTLNEYAEGGSFNDL